ncbi:helix-turn-helix domain-containing protein [Fodinibius sediminis]|uniref:Helix-turn-helix domain-containing protein n=1 Tax=Fodinibius sediminis TaxID=1214077 RepID=A0A521C9M7_9BACT|nr:helix-turn-helix transcriptional regulator [Fodinibius sediminis]SMO56187.1 Helix-turn-helix domain-containing protein [Fodinibius sediminis]
MPSLGNDLATIRKSRGISLEEIYRSTKIPKAVLASIEDDTIFSDIGSNPTYIRSYVRSYAKALSIEERKIVHALNKVEKGSYSGSLIEEEQRQKMPEEANSKEDEPSAKGEAKEEVAHEETENPLLKSQEVSKVDWANMGRQFQPTRTARSNRWIIASVVIVLAVAAFWGYWYYLRGEGPSAGKTTPQESPAQTTTPADSPDLDTGTAFDGDSALRQTSPQFTGPRETLPDTLSIVLYAAYGKLEPVRVYTDILDELNPYWIETGEAIRFDFVNDFHFRNGEGNIILLMNGRVISDFRERFLNPETNRIEIHRSFFEGDSKWLQPPPDTLNIDVPPPSVIHTLQY